VHKSAELQIKIFKKNRFIACYVIYSILQVFVAAMLDLCKLCKFAWRDFLGLCFSCSRDITEKPCGKIGFVAICLKLAPQIS
jgi:hypothetical protein